MIKEIVLGESVALRFRRHAPSRTGPLDHTITAHAMADFRAVKDVMEFAK